MAIDPMKVWERYFGSAEEGTDYCGARIVRIAHDQPTSDYRWEVDHIVPRRHGGTNRLSNLRPLHWENNQAKGDRLDGQWRCARTG